MSVYVTKDMVLRLVFFQILSWICIRISIIHTNQIRRRCSVEGRRILFVIVITTFIVVVVVIAVIFVVVTVVVVVIVILLFVLVKKLYCYVCVANQFIFIFNRNSKAISSVLTKIAGKLLTEEKPKLS